MVAPVCATTAAGPDPARRIRVRCRVVSTRTTRGRLDGISLPTPAGTSRAMRAAERPRPIPVPPCPFDHRDDLVWGARRARPHPVDLDRPRPGSRTAAATPPHRGEPARRTRHHGTGENGTGSHATAPLAGAAPPAINRRRENPGAHHATATDASLSAPQAAELGPVGVSRR